MVNRCNKLCSGRLLLPWLIVCCLLPLNTLRAENAIHDSSGCTAIKSSLERLECFDSYFKTPIHLPEPDSRTESTKDYQPEILRTVERIEKKRTTESSEILVQKYMDHESSGQKRMILSAPAIGAHPPRPLLVISCINNITRFQIGFMKPVPLHSTQITLSLDNRSIGGDYLWQIIESGKLVDAGRGIPSINILKKISGYERLTIESDYKSLNGLIFDISRLDSVLPEFRQSCHW